MAQTKQEIRKAWDKANLQRYAVSLHKTNDKELIDKIEERKANGERTSDIFREAISLLD